MNKLRILLADDHAILREGLVLLINAQPDMEVIAQADTGRDAVRLAMELTPDVAVLDVSMPVLGGAEAAEQILKARPHVRVVALTRHAEQGYLRRLLSAGAKGYVVKKTAADALIHAIRTVAAGGTYIDPSLTAGLAERVLAIGGGSPGPRRSKLTERETEVLRLIAWGHSNKKAAAHLGLSVKTVESYKAGAVEKLHLRSRSDILRYALEQGWLSTDSAPE